MQMITAGGNDQRDVVCFSGTQKPITMLKSSAREQK